jgi:hypothetical protein
MVRRWRLIALALAGGAVLAFPSAGSALSAVFITLGPSGPAPTVLTIGGSLYPVWENTDTVEHTVSFANGLCSFQVAPGQIGQCSTGLQLGQNPYTVDGKFQASIAIVKVLGGRTVTLGARSHTIKRGAHLRLHGMLDYETGSPPVFYSDMPVTVLARHDRQHAFHAIATVAKRVRRRSSGGFPWQLYVHPKRTTIYIAKASSDGETWQPATSGPFKVLVRR